MKIYNVKIKTMDSDRRVIENGWVEITDGIISAVESGSPEAVKAEAQPAKEEAEAAKVSQPKT